MKMNFYLNRKTGECVARVFINEPVAASIVDVCVNAYEGPSKPDLYFDSEAGEEFYQINGHFFDCAVIPSCDQIDDGIDVTDGGDWFEIFTVRPEILICIGVEIARFTTLRT